MGVDSLREVERALWFEGAAAYRRHLAHEALVVVPGATLDRRSTITAIEQAPRWQHLDMYDEQNRALGSSGLLLHYRAEAVRADGSDYTALVSSIYEEGGGDPWLVFHQQTPLP